MNKKTIEKAAALRRLWSAFWQARPLLTAVNFGLFEHTKTGASARQVAGRIKADPRATGILMDALAGLGLLKKSGEKSKYRNSTESIYRNTEEAGLFLVKDSPYYQGAIVRHADNLWRSWSQLDESLRTGKPAPRESGEFSLDAFIMGMHNLAALRAGDIIKAIGMKGVGSALDLGGGPGTYSMEMARAGVGKVTLFDRADVIKIAARNIKNQKKQKQENGVGNNGNIGFMKGDFNSDDFGGGYDLIFMSNILHSNSYEQCEDLLGRARAALNPGGRAAINEFYLEDNRIAPLSGALFSINMLVNTEAGCTYTHGELKGFLKKAGFRDIKAKVLFGDAIVVTGRVSG
ncbi:MAG: methyltransferase [Nitrospiraceae bacterium]|nr:methyltransferase [Nitrospiraceae bacterium]